MQRRLIVAALGGVLAIACRPRFAQSEEQVDTFGGAESVAANKAQRFHLEKIGKRWWLVTPEGHGIFIRAVSKIDTADYGGSGGFMAYDAVYLEAAGGTMSPNMAAAAENSLKRDVVHPKTGFTLHAMGDALYLGASRFRPNFTYFWLGQSGKGGEVKWNYSSTGGWKPLNRSGNPTAGVALSVGGAWNLDTGNYMAPDDNGFGRWDSPQANKITWWDMKTGFPADFTPTALPGDPVRRYYLKAVVEEPFRTPPVLNQLYERADLAELIQKKYGPGDFYRSWAKAITQRLRSWGFNAAGQYSYRYVTSAAGLSERLPVAQTRALGGWATRKDRPYHAKNVYAGAVFPPGSTKRIYQGLQPDVFDPRCERAYAELVASHTVKDHTWSWALIPEEADYLFGINSLTHDHLGYVVLSQNPFQNRASRDGQEIVYEDPRLYAKYALRDFLRDRYRTAGDERAALRALNAAWGTKYTTWDTSSGDLLKGDNAWGTGTGFMDENGRGVIAPGARSVSFGRSFTRAAYPAIRKDLDAFIAVFAARYGNILEKAFAPVEHPVLLLPIYNGPDFVYKALAPYVDGFWVSVPNLENAKRIYNAGRKPLVVADYQTADPDSPLYFKATIDSVRYDPATGDTTVSAPDLRYVFRMPQSVCFPDCAGLAEIYGRIGKPYPTPRVKSAHWNTLAVPGDYSAFLKPGNHIELWKYGKYPYENPTQEARARAMKKWYESLINLRGDDGVYCVLGIEHWCLYDPSVTNWCDNQNFGLATFRDNAYDGLEARRKTGHDARGYSIGGEDADYGNLLGELGTFLRGVHRFIQTRGTARGDVLMQHDFSSENLEG